jgi:S1-C subfamily serine protease
VRDLNLRRGGITFDVRADSPAAEAGITSNDFVVSVNGRTIEGYASFTDAIASAIESRDSAPVEFELRDAEDTVRFVRLQLERP